MNTVGDILKLQEVASMVLVRTGLGMLGAGGHFTARMKELIDRTFFLFCVSKAEQKGLTTDQLPPIEKMCEELKGVDQSAKLPRFAQAAYYCAVAVLLTMDGHTEEAQTDQCSRADMLMNSGVLPCQDPA